MTSSVVARIRLTPKAASVWSGLDKSVKIKLGALFNEMVTSYAREGKLPVISLQVSEDSLRLIITGFEACNRSLKACKRKIKLTKAEVNKLKQEIEMIKSLNDQLNEAKEREEQLKQHVERLQRENKHMKDRLETLANILCPRLETLKSIYSNNGRAVIELEALCWQKWQS
jgi:DNA repair exonuclease SbcCD ATPase subunit